MAASRRENISSAQIHQFTAGSLEARQWESSDEPRLDWDCTEHGGHTDTHGRLEGDERGGEEGRRGKKTRGEVRKEGEKRSGEERRGAKRKQKERSREK